MTQSAGTDFTCPRPRPGSRGDLVAGVLGHLSGSSRRARWLGQAQTPDCCVASREESVVAVYAGRHRQPAVRLQFPVEHHERVRHSNLLERTFGESRRRVKVIGRLPGEHSCLSLVWAVLDRASVGLRGIDTSVASIRRLQALRRELLGPPDLQATG